MQTHHLAESETINDDTNVESSGQQPNVQPEEHPKPDATSQSDQKGPHKPAKRRKYSGIFTTLVMILLILPLVMVN